MMDDVSHPGQDLTAPEPTATLNRLQRLLSRAGFPAVIFGVLACGIAAAGYFAFLAQQRELRRSVEHQLDSVAEIKADHIQRWWFERRGDARAFSEDGFVSRGFDAWLQGGIPSGTAERMLAAQLAVIRAAYHYKSVSLFDPAVTVELTPEGRRTTPIDAHDRELALRAMRERRIVHVDLHLEQSGAGERLVLGIAAPLLLHTDGTTRVTGALHLEIDPFEQLLNIVRFWPTDSATAETLIVRRDNDEVLYLSPLRSHPEAAGRMRLPLSQTSLPAAMAVRGVIGNVAGIDYRGVPVFAALRPIPDLNWYLVAKIDQEEIYDSLNRLAGGIALVVMLLMATAAAAVLLWWRGQRARSESALYKVQLERAALERHYDFLGKYANDIILLTDELGRIIDANDRAVQAYGYSREELLGMTTKQLRSNTARLRADQDMNLWTEAGAVYETEQQRKDGSILPVEVSGRLIDVQGRKFFQAIVRDISDRKRAEALHDYLAAVVESSTDGIIGVDLEGTVVSWNHGAELVYGYSAEDMIGRTILIVTPPEARDATRELIRRVRAGERVERYDAERVRKDGRRIQVMINLSPIRDGRGQVIGISGIVSDVTRLKESETRLEHERMQHTERLQQALVQAVTAIALTIEERDPYTAGHQQRVAQLAAAIGREMNLPESLVEGLYIGALIHDIGKIRIPAEILNRPGMLSTSEFDLVKTHAAVGYEILKDIAFPWPVAQMVLQHHERMDGSGYPAGSKGAQILIEARILAIADVVESIVSHRPYRPALPLDSALQEILDRRDTLYDADAVDACVRLFRDRNFRFQEVQLVSEAAFAAAG